jgi:hypothetical protein
MEYQNNAAGVTTITGLDDYLITGTLDQHGPMNGVLVNGTRYAYYAKYADIANGTDYETGQGTWSGDNTLSRDTITTSSNAGNSVNWGSGQKAIYIVADAELSTDMEQMVEGATKKILTVSERSSIATMKSKVDLITITQAADLDQMVIDIGGALMDSEVTSLTGVKTLVIPDNTAVTAHGKDIVGAAAAANSRAVIGLGNSSTLNIGTTSGTVAAGDDARFGSVDIDDLTPATSIDGTEILPAQQGASPVSVTTQQVAGTPLTVRRSHNLTKYRGFSNLSSVGPSTIGVHKAILGAEQIIPYLTSGGAVSSAVGTTLAPSIALSTDTNSNGAAAILHADYPASLYFGGEKTFDMRMRIQPGILPTGPENYTLQVGYTNGALTDFAAVTDTGIYIELASGSPNWFLCVKAGANLTRIDSGVAAVANTAVTLRIAHDQAQAKSRFWIDGIEQASILDSTRVLPDFTLLGMMAGIWKSAGTTARSAILYGYYYDNQSAAMPWF